MQKDERLLTRLRYHSTHMKVWPVPSRHGLWHGSLLRQCQRVQVAEVDQASCPAEGNGNEQDHARE